MTAPKTPTQYTPAELDRVIEGLEKLQQLGDTVYVSVAELSIAIAFVRSVGELQEENKRLRERGRVLEEDVRLLVERMDDPDLDVSHIVKRIIASLTPDKESSHE